MRLNKACELEDFSDPSFISTVQKIFGPAEKGQNGWPQGYEDRKFWEVAMVVLTMERHLPSSRREAALGVGAGTEASNFILTNYFERVVATDLYGGNWNRDAPSSMLTDPARHAGSVPFQPERLIVQEMDGRRLDFADETFDLVYSASSIEHFGEMEDLARAAAEMGRVLRRGGLLAISTELGVNGKSGRLDRGTLILSEEEIEKYIVAPSGCAPVDRPDYHVSAPTKSRPTHFYEALQQLHTMRSRMQDRWARYPHIVIEMPPFAWTSAQIALRKPTP